MNRDAFQDASRKQESLLARPERAVLFWIADRLPAPIHSDHLTALGFAGFLLAALSYASSRYDAAWLHLASLGLAINWFGDSLDGTLARRRGCERPRYGFYVDHILDTFGASAVMIGIARSGYMTRELALLVLVVYLVLAINSFLAAYSLGIFRISYWKFGPTEWRIAAIVGNFYLTEKPWVTLFGDRYRLLDAGGAVCLLIMAAIVLVSSVVNTRRLYRMEPLP